MDYALKARVALAMANVLSPFNPDRAEDFESCACEMAHSHGFSDEGSPEHPPSPYLGGAPMLLKAARDGRREREEDDERRAAIPNFAWEDRWQSSLDGRAETMAFVVKTEEGFCAGFMVSYGGGDSGPYGWGEPHPTLEAAKAEARESERLWHAAG